MHLPYRSCTRTLPMIRRALSCSGGGIRLNTAAASVKYIFITRKESHTQSQTAITIA